MKPIIIAALLVASFGAARLHAQTVPDLQTASLASTASASSEAPSFVADDDAAQNVDPAQTPAVDAAPPADTIEFGTAEFRSGQIPWDYLPETTSATGANGSASGTSADAANRARVAHAN